MKHILSSLFACSLLIFLSINNGNAQNRSHASSATVSGQTTPVRPGSVILNLGIGEGSEYSGDYYHSPFGLKAAIEWGIWKAGPGTITLGAELGNSFSNGGYYYDNYRSTTTVIAARSAWHYGWRVKGLDTYGGLSAGMGFHHYDYLNDGTHNFNSVIPVIGAFVGASYFVTRHFGFNAEVGYDITDLQLGVVFKLK